MSVFLCLVFNNPCFSLAQETAESARPFRVVLVVSAHIRPYIEALDGLRGELDRVISAEVEVVTLDRFDETAGMDLARRMVLEKPTDLVAAIGPEAASLVWGAFSDSPFPRIYSLILNPENVVGPKDVAAGISLNISPAVQLQMIRQALPSLHRIGIFYDPAHNRAFYEAASTAAADLSLELVPMVVSERKDIPFLLQQCFDALDGIWLIPDRTVISESIARYIIKQSVLEKIPVIGYNQFFYDSGAALAFVFDYAALGRQTAGRIVEALKKRKTGAHSPVFEVWLNPAVLDKAGIAIPTDIRPPVKVGP